MPLDNRELTKVPRKLRKAVKELRDEASVEQVHRIRTRSRRLEALLHALERDSRKNERILLKAIKPVRKKAGKVRDADVLIGFASQIRLDQGEEDCSLRLLEYLGAKRLRGCKKLKKAADAQSPKITRRTKNLERFLGKALGNGDSELQTLSDDAAVAALHAARKLQKWPALSRTNLHPFRLAVKELRNMLRVAQRPDPQLVADLGAVKDAIGEWHDWDQLSAIAKDVIQHPGCELLKIIHNNAREKLENALTLSNAIRKRDFSDDLRRGGKSTTGKADSNPMIRKTSSIAPFSKSAAASVSALAA